MWHVGGKSSDPEFGMAAEPHNEIAFVPFAKIKRLLALSTLAKRICVLNPFVVLSQMESSKIIEHILNFG